MRAEILNKYNGHCAYCGKKITLKDMQKDHIVPKRLGGGDILDNLNPSCRRCNHYKRGNTLEGFRELLLTLHNRVSGYYINKFAEDYGVIRVEPWDGVFYFEKEAKS